MRALIQRVTEASVTVDDHLVSCIQSGLCVFLGVGKNDTRVEAVRLSGKIVSMRIFADSEGKMNLSLLDKQAELLVVPQFTLYGDTSRGNRPSYSDAAPPPMAEELFEFFVSSCREHGCQVKTGVFQAHMQIRLLNDGPVTLLCFSGE